MLSQTMTASATALMSTLYQGPSAVLVVWGYGVLPAVQRLSLPRYVMTSPFYVAHGYAAMSAMQLAAGQLRAGPLLARVCEYEAAACCLVGALDWRMRRSFVAAQGSHQRRL
jgi:hypothetical protein